MQNKTYTSILINYEADEADGLSFGPDGQCIVVNGEMKGMETLPNEVQAKFNAERMWTLANNFCWVAMDRNARNLKRAYIGLLEEGGRKIFS